MGATLLLLLLVAQSGTVASRAPSPPAPAAAAIPPPATDWPPYSLFTDDDYPAVAIRGGHEGLVLYRLEIGADGRVGGCTIRSSSGSAALDLATCRILRNRARFAPARDSDGNPVPDARDGEITWRLPDDD